MNETNYLITIPEKHNHMSMDYIPHLTIKIEEYLPVKDYFSTFKSLIKLYLITKTRYIRFYESIINSPVQINKNIKNNLLKSLSYKFNSNLKELNRINDKNFKHDNNSEVLTLIYFSIKLLHCAKDKHCVLDLSNDTVLFIKSELLNLIDELKSKAPDAHNLIRGAKNIASKDSNDLDDRLPELILI